MPDPDERVSSHPSYGLLSFSRTTNTGGQTLFGSSIRHSHTMRLRLDLAELHRHLNYDSYYPKGQIAEVEMSPTQFAELITSANIGCGVPVTVKWLRGEGYIPAPTFENKRLQFEDEFGSKVKQVTESLLQLTKRSKELLAAPGGLKKPEKEELLAVITKIVMEVRQNLPFVASQFNEQMDKTVSEAKGETEAFFRHIIEGLGIEHLRDRLEKIIPTLDEHEHQPTLPDQTP